MTPPPEWQFLRERGYPDPTLCLPCTQELEQLARSEAMRPPPASVGERMARESDESKRLEMMKSLARATSLPQLRSDIREAMKVIDAATVLRDSLGAAMVSDQPGKSGVLSTIQTIIDSFSAHAPVLAEELANRGETL